MKDGRLLFALWLVLTGAVAITLVVSVVWLRRSTSDFTSAFADASSPGVAEPVRQIEVVSNVLVLLGVVCAALLVTMSVLAMRAARKAD